MPSHAHEPGTPMPHTHAHHLLNPLRSFVLSPGSLVRQLELQPHFSVLELGPGPGYFSPAVARAVPEGKLVLADIQEEMLDMARDRLENERVNNVEYVEADALALPFDDGAFDAAFLVAVLGEVPDRAVCVRELHRVLRPGGHLLVTELPLFDPDSVSAAELQSIAEDAGFRSHSRRGLVLHRSLGFWK